MPFHPRNKHKGKYDFPELIKELPALKKHVLPNKFGNDSIDFSNQESVKALNRALLKLYYGIESWDIPKDYLIQPIL